MNLIQILEDKKKEILGEIKGMSLMAEYPFKESHSLLLNRAVSEIDVLVDTLISINDIEVYHKTYRGS
jgi:hypothetical protein